LLPLAIATAVPATARAGEPQEGGQLWPAVVAQGRLGFVHPRLARLRGWLELHARLRSLGESFELGFFPRFALGYAFDDRLSFDAGFAPVANDPPRAKPYTELRPWQQLTWNLPVDALPIQWRTRLEQRIHQENVGWRLREFLKASVPLPGSDRFYLATFDEVFFDLDDTTWGQRRGLRQNRFFVGPGARLDRDRHVALEVGYLHQWIDRRREDRVNHVLSLNLFLNY